MFKQLLPTANAIYNVETSQKIYALILGLKGLISLTLNSLCARKCVIKLNAAKFWWAVDGLSNKLSVYMYIRHIV